MKGSVGNPSDKSAIIRGGDKMDDLFFKPACLPIIESCRLPRNQYGLNGSDIVLSVTLDIIAKLNIRYKQALIVKFAIFSSENWMKTVNS